MRMRKLVLGLGIGVLVSLIMLVLYGALGSSEETTNPSSSSIYSVDLQLLNDNVLPVKSHYYESAETSATLRIIVKDQAGQPVTQIPSEAFTATGFGQTIIVSETAPGVYDGTVNIGAPVVMGWYCVKVILVHQDTHGIYYLKWLIAGMGDINRDGYVDSLDQALLQQAYGTKKNDANYNEQCDLTGDNDEIDILDAVALSSHWGQFYTYPGYGFYTITAWLTNDANPPYKIRYFRGAENTAVLWLKVEDNGQPVSGLLPGDFRVAFYNQLITITETETPGIYSGTLDIFTPPMGWHGIEVVLMPEGYFRGFATLKWLFCGPGDITADGVVNNADRDLLVGAYGTKKGDAKYREDCDIARDDDRVDIYDLVTLSSNWGKLYQYPDYTSIQAIWGQRLKAWFEPPNWEFIQFKVIETLAPYQPAVSWESTAPVTDTTQGILTFSYTNIYGESIEVKRIIEVNNVTREISYEGKIVQTLGEIFAPLSSPPSENTMYLSLQFDNPITIYFVFSNSGCAKEPPTLLTDKEGKVETRERVPSPSLAEAEGFRRMLEEQGLINKITEVITMPATGTYGQYDCHGWTFTCGHMWIDNAQVQKILVDNGYKICTKDRPPKEGDIVIYRDPQGNIKHSGIVTKVEGGVVKEVESKWSKFRGYKHAPEDVPKDDPATPQFEGYGTPEYYYTERKPGVEGKDKHNLIVACGCLGLEPFVLFFIIWLIKRWKRGWGKGYFVYGGTFLISLILVISLTACGIKEPSDNTIWETEKSEIVQKIKGILDSKANFEITRKTFKIANEDPEFTRKIIRVLDEATPETVRSINEILDHIFTICPWSFLSGQHLKTWINPDGWDTRQIRAIETLAPYQPAVSWESTAPVGDTTQGTLIFSYTDASGKCVEVKRVIEIDNRTRVISYKGSTVATLEEIFNQLPSPPREKTITLSLDFDHPVTIYIGP